MPLRKADLCSIFQRPEAALFAELPRRRVQEFPQHLGPLFVEGGVDFLGARGGGREGSQTPFVELVDGVAHGLLSASEVFGYAGAISPRALARSIWQRRK